MIYVIQAATGGPVKIGYTSGETIDARLRGLQAACPWPLVVLRKFPGDPTDEYLLHRQFAAQRLHGEWFDPVGTLLDWLTSAHVRVLDVVKPDQPPLIGPLPRALAIVLSALQQQDGWTLPSTIAMQIDSTTAAVSTWLRALHRRGLVWKRPIVIDGRGTREWRSHPCLTGGQDFAL